MEKVQKDRQLNIQNMVMNVCFFVAYCSVMMYCTLYLTEKGFAPLTIGLMFGFANLIATFLQDMLARWADRPSGPSLKSLALGQIATGIMTILPVVFFQPPKTYVFFAFLVQATILISVQTTLYTLSMTYEERGHKLQFSMIRGVGSLGFATTSLLMGFYVKSFPIDHILWVEVLALLLTCLVILTLPDLPKLREEAKSSEREEAGPSSSLFGQYPVFWGLLVGFSLLFIGHMVVNNYMAFVIDKVHGDPGNLGIAIMLGAVSEMPAMFFYSKIRKKRSDSDWMKVAAIAFTVKHLILALATSMSLVYFSQAIQFFSYGLFTPSFAYFAAQTVSIREKTQAQGISIAAQSIGGALGSFFGGAIIQFLGISMTLYAVVALSAVGTAIVILSLKRAEERKRRRARQQNPIV